MKPFGSLDIPLLSDLSEDERYHVLDCMTIIELPPSAVVFHEGDLGDSLYVVASGEVEILKAMGTSEDHLLVVSGMGDFFGEVALLDSQGHRSASARARGQVTLLQMTAAEFHRLMQTHPAVASQLIHIISSRLRSSSDATIRDLEAKNRILAQAYHELKVAQALVIEKEKLEKELDIAREIQISMLPEILPQAAGYSFGVHMQAARWLGGDFYDLFPLDDDHIAVVVGDVSDKGVPSALYMALTRSLLRAEALRLESPSRTLRRVNTLLQDMSTAGLFVTVLFGMLDVRSGYFNYARAGHELPILLRADGSVTPIKSTTGMVLGVLPEILIDEEELQLLPGDMLQLFTDGATDAVNPLNQRFGHDRLVQEMQACRTINGQAACDRILAAILNYQRSAPQFDDITLLTVCADSR